MRFVHLVNTAKVNVRTETGLQMCSCGCQKFFLTFQAFINFRLPYFMLSYSCPFFIFSSHISFFISHHSFFDPTLLFDALSIEIPPEFLLHLCSSYFCHLYELLLRLFRHFFFLKKFFFIVKLINFFYM